MPSSGPVSAQTWATPHPVVGLLASTRRYFRCLLAPAGADIERLRRRVYELEFGELPPGTTLKTRCHRRCLNPWHLKLKRERGPDGRVTHCKRGHLLHQGSAYQPPGGGRRVCRECALEGQRRRAGRLHLLPEGDQRQRPPFNRSRSSNVIRADRIAS